MWVCRLHPLERQKTPVLGHGMKAAITSDICGPRAKTNPLT